MQTGQKIESFTQSRKHVNTEGRSHTDKQLIWEKKQEVRLEQKLLCLIKSKVQTYFSSKSLVNDLMQG